MGLLGLPSPSLRSISIFVFSLITLITLVSCQGTLITADAAHQLVGSSHNAGSQWWFANIYRQGSIPYRNYSSMPITAGPYVLYRNVRDYGAKGDGVTNDTQALLNALADGTRCAGQWNVQTTNQCNASIAMGVCCESSTVLPAIVYFPPGTYIITAPVIMYYNSILVGDALNVPTIKAHPTFAGIALLDSDPYYPFAGDQNSWYANQNNFWRQVRNFVLDITPLPFSSTYACIHWQVAQATSLQNIVMNMRIGGGTANKQWGIFMENGSGGFMRDLIFNGGAYGFFLGNQQFTSSNLTFNYCQVAVWVNFDWLWSFKHTFINNCGIGFLVYQGTPAKPSVGSVTISDTVFTNTTTGVITDHNCTQEINHSESTLIIDNVDFRGAVNAIVAKADGSILLPGGSVVQSWISGNVYAASYQPQFFARQNLTCYVPKAPPMCVDRQMAQSAPIPTSLKDSNGMIFDRGKPSYDNLPLSKFVSAKDNGCVGDGYADDTDCLQKLFNNALPDQVIYIDHGAYVVTKPVFVPSNIRVMGEAWPLIVVQDTNQIWADLTNPSPVFSIGAKGDVGSLEMQDLLFETRGPTPGAILMEWNLAGSGPGTAGMWDVHWRIGGTAGTQLQVTQCRKDPSTTITSDDFTQFYNRDWRVCMASFLLLHITATASLYMENNWGWVSDHELDGDGLINNPASHDQVNVFNGRGILVESIQPTWIVGSSFEHSMLYNYQVANAKNLYMSAIQSETAYMQDNPNADVPFPPDARYDDPTFDACGSQSGCKKTWGLRIYQSSYIFIYGAGLYSFFDNYASACIPSHSCQQSIVSVEQSEVVYIFDLFTIGANSLVTFDGTPLVPYGENLDLLNLGACIALFEYV